jgi:UDP-glucose 4-epimerase
MYHNVFNLKYAILRICVPYGTLIEGASSYGTAEFMLSKATNGENIHIYGDGSVRRTLTHISDLCAVMYKAALNNDVVNDVYNVGGEEYSLADMAKLIAKKYGVSVDYGEWPEVALKIESNDTVFDSSKLDDIIGNLYEHSFVTWIDSNC